MNNMQGNVFDEGDEGDEGVQTLLVEIDNDPEEQNWWYFPPDVPYSDYFSYYRTPDLIGELLQATTVTFTIDTTAEPFVFTFNVAGLEQHIQGAEDLWRQLTFEVVFPTIQANNNRPLDGQLKESSA